jgi:hypothetical protein
LGYSSLFTDNITVLSSKYVQTVNNAIQGLLYVPDLNPGDPCEVDSREFLPDGVVHQSDLPPTNYNLIAIAPWFNVTCTKEYMASARSDNLRLFIFYKPYNESGEPPAANSPAWNLGDEGRWKIQNHYPVIAVSGVVGQELVTQLGRYIGSLSNVPNGRNISDLYDATADDYARIWTQITVTTTSTLPTIWVFVLIIVCVLLAVIAATSLLMHFVQSRRRASLRIRVINGEVNLEGMGIKRMTVPQVHIEKFPLFTYNYEPEISSPPASPTSPNPISQGNKTRHSRGRSESVATTALPISEKGLDSPFASSTIATDYQPACAICLDHYQNRVTVIRELSCGHIFHPECIDEFLSENSSLCPLCKACMLPKGYCPKITNAMVRRERAIRRLRDRMDVGDSDSEMNSGRMQNWSKSIKKRIFKSTSPVSRPDSTELRQQRRRSSPIQIQTEPVSSENRADLARARMRQLAGGSELDEEEVRFRGCKFDAPSPLSLQPSFSKHKTNHAGYRDMAEKPDIPRLLSSPPLPRPVTHFPIFILAQFLLGW